MLDTTLQNSRYKAGVKHLDPEKILKIQEILKANPKAKKTEIAKLAGISRTLVYFYLREMPSYLQIQENSSELKAQAIMSQLDLVQSIQKSIHDIQKMVSNESLTYEQRLKGFSTCIPYFRLYGELIGEVQPASQNIYLTQIQQLLCQELPQPIRSEDKG